MLNIKGNLQSSIPLNGMLDLTYRCNNRCLHCWLWVDSKSKISHEELNFDEIRHIVDDARQLGCQAWKISGGEPMLRPDFPEIFDYITRKAVHYSLNTNGTLITSQIAKLLTRKGRKMIALYGATADIHDRVTRTPSSFDAMQQGLAYLKEAGAGFEIQVIPLRENFHQFDQMLEMARSFTPNCRIGSDWLFFSACGSRARNRMIANQRLAPSEVIAMDPPNPLDVSPNEEADAGKEKRNEPCTASDQDDRLYAACIPGGHEFHIDPYGMMSFCYYIKDPALRYDLRKGSFREAWEEFIPSLADVVHGGQEYLENCGSCELRRDCLWCPVYGYLEHGRHSAKVEYLCQLAEETRKYKQQWRSDHLRYYSIAGVTIQVSADLPISDDMVAPPLAKFRVEKPSPDMVYLHHSSPIPPRSSLHLGKEVYSKQPWAIYHQRNSWVYLGIPSGKTTSEPNVLAIFNENHTRGTIYHKEDFFKKVGLESLTTFPTDQILLARILAERQAFYVHASGINLNGQGLLFIGHSGAGKSTTMKMFKDQGEILCDDRMIIRKWPAGVFIHGTWSHGELPDVSPAGVPLRAIFYLEKSKGNALIPLKDTQEKLARILSCIIKPLATADWWEKILETAGKIAAEVPAYRMQFNLNGEVVHLLEQLLRE